MGSLLLFALLVAAATRCFTRGAENTPGARIPEPDNASLAQAAARAAAEAERLRRAARTSATAERAPRPWPQALPSGLPAFPGGWEFAEPVTPAVRTRAWQLLSTLWAAGKGATKVERTGDEWITYRAEITKGNKRGVVAYRPRRGAPPARLPPGPTVRRPGAAPGLPASTSPAALPTSSPPALPRATSSSPGLPRPTLHQGAGMGSLAHLAPYVKQVQQALRLGLVDGLYGKGTRAAVEAFQRSHHLEADGIVGPNTWAALVPATAAA